MKKNILLLIFFITGMLSFAQNGAKIEFKEETINYGTVVKGEDSGKRIFEFTNTGNEPLVIKDAKSSCGCTVPSFPKEPIAPGATSTIEVQYNMNPGPISKTITVTTNAINKESGMIALRIKGLVIVKEEKSVLEKKKEGPRL
ncbi:Protein of unknown function precursor [Flavobacterium indicum GPTSA100-9 = DSM 17447]|uniref:DUF1573 domain-containing protein n=1 Tax=Flavobacterium indicum (strain DSM 17447 / CIP 109464 / GPTSA100-9) TaxID=1094466 RepID=H8XTU9_FLAIG|nr:DUF1573 domain-containing protein [Flavobacterium indicum]CCG53679.1 Protein of unknown function precursor [Flavobacterium indicum GPTSA100-9 = DSM 17447]